jgi:catechol 2,3-dioxygenase-like lactoylglutathione lyase family enzyme
VHAQATAVLDLSGIAHAAIRVADLERSRSFYEKLGFDEAFAFASNGTPSQAFLKINDKQFLELYTRREASQAIGFMHVCFESNNLEGLNRAYLARSLSPTVVKKAAAGNLLFTMPGPEEQNIEYTQYMPGSRHSNDVGQHLGATRISKELIGAGIEMQDDAAAASFYTAKLGFSRAPAPLQKEFPALNLPGSSGQAIEFVPQHAGLRLIFAVPQLPQAESRLKGLHLAFHKSKSEITVQDPDGNLIVFVKARS